MKSAGEGQTAQKELTSLRREDLFALETSLMPLCCVKHPLCTQQFSNHLYYVRNYLHLLYNALLQIPIM